MQEKTEEKEEKQNKTKQHGISALLSITSFPSRASRYNYKVSPEALSAPWCLFPVGQEIPDEKQIPVNSSPVMWCLNSRLLSQSAYYCLLSSFYSCIQWERQGTRTRELFLPLEMSLPSSRPFVGTLVLM